MSGGFGLVVELPSNYNCREGSVGGSAVYLESEVDNNNALLLSANATIIKAPLSSSSLFVRYAKRCYL
jgi:hypothetical protein